MTQRWKEGSEKNWSQREALLENEQQKKHQQNFNHINGHEIILSSIASDSIIETKVNSEESCPTIEQVLPGSTASAVNENRPFPMDPFGDIISQMAGQNLHGSEDAFKLSV